VSGVTLAGVTKRYGDVTAVDDLSLEVADGELLVLLGPSGCGKTTVLRMIAGLEEVTSGEVRIGGRPVNDVAPKDRDVAMVFQSYALYPHMTVARNIESPLLARKMQVDPGQPPRRLRSTERRERVAQVAASVGLTDLLDRKPAALSGGQRQRVALARAMVARPAAFLMDEPLSNLDAQLRVQTRLELVELHQRLSSTFVYVTHDQVEAMTMADRIAVMAHGRLQQVGPPQEVYDRPSNLFVADFLGSPPMNTLAGTVRRGEAGLTVVVGDVEIPLARTDGDRPEVGAEVVVGVRPEHVAVDPAGELDARVSAIESLGHERLLVCAVEGTRLVVRQPSAAAPTALGAQLRLRLDPTGIHLFDPLTGERTA
jgi:multiple sugar transport system ATP-binding protein